MIKDTMSDGDKTIVGAAARPASWLKGGGDMGELVRTYDWSKTSLGPIESWPNELKTIVSVVLNSRFPMQIWWGKDLVQIYNDAYRPITRHKHPEALGANGFDIWPEAWSIIGPMAERVIERGESNWWEDFQFFIQSGDMLEEGYFTFSHSPIYVDGGTKVGGILTVVHETTESIINERRLEILYDLAVHSVGRKSEGEIYRNIMNVLSGYDEDLPFGALFKCNSTSPFRLTGAVGLMRYEGPLKDPKKWPLREAFDGGKPLYVDITFEQFGLLPKNIHGVSAKQAIILPLTVPEADLEVALVIALSPHRKHSAGRQHFISALQDQLTTVITSARSYETGPSNAGGSQ